MSSEAAVKNITQITSLIFAGIYISYTGIAVPSVEIQFSLQKKDSSKQTILFSNNNQRQFQFCEKRMFVNSSGKGLIQYAHVI